MNNKLTIRVTGCTQRERTLVMAMLQLAFRQLGSMAALETDDHGQVLAEAADDYSLQQKLLTLVSGAQILVTDKEPEAPALATPVIPDHLG